MNNIFQNNLNLLQKVIWIGKMMQTAIRLNVKNTLHIRKNTPKQPKKILKEAFF